MTEPLHDIRRYLDRIAEARRDAEAADDLDDRIGARQRADQAMLWLGWHVYENAHLLGFSETPYV